MKISLIIPTLNAAEYLPKLIDILERQTLKADEIIVADSQSEDETVALAKEAGWKVMPVLRKDFDHGGTRNYAVDNAIGDIVLFLSQDAIPADEKYIENIVKGFADEDVVMISARQLPRRNAKPDEALIRQFNYPSESFVRDKSDIEKLGIKAYFFSDVCSAYRKDFFKQIGGFEAPILTNEDMLMAARALTADRKIGYTAEAKVYHSHNYTFGQQYKRNFDVAAFMKMYENEIKGEGTTGEGIRMVLFVEKELLKHLSISAAIHCVFDSAAKFMGNRAGRKYAQMSEEKILDKTSNRNYWINQFGENY